MPCFLIKHFGLKQIYYSAWLYQSPQLCWHVSLLVLCGSLSLLGGLVGHCSTLLSCQALKKYWTPQSKPVGTGQMHLRALNDHLLFDTFVMQPILFHLTSVVCKYCFLLDGSKRMKDTDYINAANWLELVCWTWVRDQLHCALCVDFPLLLFCSLSLKVSFCC